MKIPTRDEARLMLAEAETKNPGPWVAHSLHVAQAAEKIAARHPRLDAGAAYVCGLLHDIGRQEGVTDLRHTLDGYRFLTTLGYEDAARICLTHSFPIKGVKVYSGHSDLSEADEQFIEQFLMDADYSAYDQLVQLCDSLALPGGYCLIEKRLVDVVLRHGVNDYTVRKWQAYFHIQHEMEAVIGCSVYSLLPGVVANTFGFEP